jgi:predicted nucleic acid-binding protein
MSDYLAASIRVTITGSVAGVCRDPKDDHILECAVKARAQVLISGDKDLLTLGTFHGIRILTARQYLEAS